MKMKLSLSLVLSGLVCHVAADFNVFQNVHDVFFACPGISTSCNACSGGTAGSSGTLTAPIEGIPGSPPDIFTPGPFTINSLCGSQSLDFYTNDPNNNGKVGVYVQNASPPELVATCVQNTEPVTCGEVSQTAIFMDQVFQCTSSRVCGGS
jgi:hypothetical protein